MVVNNKQVVSGSLKGLKPLDRIGYNTDSLMIMLKTTIPYYDAKKMQNALERLSGVIGTCTCSLAQN